MEHKNHLYEPVINFRKHRPEIQITIAEHSELYEKAFLSVEETTQSEYGQNTTTWD